MQVSELDGLVNRPLGELRLLRSRPFHGPRQPQSVPSRQCERLPAICTIQHHPETRVAMGDGCRRLYGQCIEHRYSFASGAGGVGRRFQVCALVHCERHDRLRCRPASGHPMQMVEFRIFAKRPFDAAVLQEMLQLSPRRVFRGT